jgi:excisionase family DNA binding protein
VSFLDRRYKVTVAEYAEATGMKPDTVREWCRKGKLRCKKLGPRKWRILARELRRR